jgi:hypothetical protein
LTEVAGPGIAVPHSYARAGRRHAVDQQWLRAGTPTRLRRASTTLPPRFGLAVVDARRQPALQREQFVRHATVVGTDRSALTGRPARYGPVRPGRGG